MLQERFSPFSTFVLLLATEGLVGSWLSLVHTPSQVGFDALDHLYPEIAESPELHFEYEIEEAVFSSNSFSDLGLSPE
jgi:hypothetical protein